MQYVKNVMKKNVNKLIGFINNLNKLTRDKFIKDINKKEIVIVKSNKGLTIRKVGKHERAKNN